MQSESNWKLEWKKALRTAKDLAQHGFIPSTAIADYEPLLEKYQFCLPEYYANLIDKKDRNCPIRLQAIPDLEELKKTKAFFTDPLRDLSHQPAPRLTHRYEGRALLHLTSLCSMYCRFCFRKSLLNELKPNLFGGEIEKAFSYLRKNSSIEEIIFSGGDPFLANEDLLRGVIEEVEKIPHVERIRFHTRVPVTFPSRVTPSFSKIVNSGKKEKVFVVHFNHPKEITSQSLCAINNLQEKGALCFNQTVLLKGVNNASPLLAELFKILGKNKVIPYYLHHPDRALGTSHFDLTKKEGLALWKELRRKLPGYLVPRYVIDEVKSPYKKLVSET